ncbi:MAG: PhzF family phenazine biosynthesis protein, partial [Acidimicrobiales bacterium]
MKGLRIRTVDAFTDRAFAGNPAAVVVLDHAAPLDWMAKLAREMNLSETAFVVRRDEATSEFDLRWFTPATEVDMCGHATLAAAHCLFADGVTGPIRFSTRSGVLAVELRADGLLVMDFPARPAKPIATPDGLAKALGAVPQWVGRGGTDDIVALLDSESTLRCLRPDQAALARIDARGIIVTAAAEPNAAYDFTSRFFGPAVGVAEDPVTGSAHTVLGPFWAERLGRSNLVGHQVSARGGVVAVELAGDRIYLSGAAV